MGRRDWGKQAKRQLTMLVRNELTLNGLLAEVYPPEVAITEYEDIYPEFNFPAPADPEVRARIRVLLSEPVSGLAWTDQISYSDKLEDQYQITSLTELGPEVRLKIFFPDGKWLFIRITEALLDHPYSSIGYNYIGVAI